MIYAFEHMQEVGGLPVGAITGTARIGPLYGSDTWQVTGIVLDTIRGLKASVELPPGHMLYPIIALWLLTTQRDEIDEAWAERAMRRPVEAVLV